MIPTAYKRKVTKNYSVFKKDRNSCGIFSCSEQEVSVLSEQDEVLIIFDATKLHEDGSFTMRYVQGMLAKASLVIPVGSSITTGRGHLQTGRSATNLCFRFVRIRCGKGGWGDKSFFRALVLNDFFKLWAAIFLKIL